MYGTFCNPRLRQHGRRNPENTDLCKFAVGGHLHCQRMPNVTCSVIGKSTCLQSQCLMHEDWQICAPAFYVFIIHVQGYEFGNMVGYADCSHTDSGHTQDKTRMIWLIIASRKLFCTSQRMPSCQRTSAS